MSKKLFLLDGMALIYRAYFAFIRNPMINSKGRNTSAIFGFLNTLLEILEKQEPTHIAVAFDVSGPTFRHDEYPEYKAQREDTPEEIRSAIPAVKELLEAFNIPVLTRQGFEADDIIGTLARKAEAEGFDTTMVTPDKDFAQLVDEHTFMMKPAKGGAEAEVLGVNEVLEQWGIEKVEQVIDILGLAGDTADNIPGVPGIGPKTAQKLIAQYGSIENLLKHTGELKGKQKENIEANKTTVKLCKRLVTIHTDVPLDIDPAGLIRGELNEEKLMALFAEYELNTFAKRLFGKAPPPAPGAGYAAPAASDGQGDLFSFAAQQAPPAPAKEEPSFKTISDVKHKYHLVQTAEDRQKLAQKLMGAATCCFDTETTGLDPRVDKLIGLSFAIQPHEAWYVTLPPSEEETQKALEPFKAVFENEEIEKTGHNLKFDIAMLREAGVEVKGRLFDTMLAHYLLDPDQRHGLDRLAGNFLQYAPIPISALTGETKKDQIHMTNVPLDKLSDYACEDADITLQLRGVLEPLLQKNGLTKSFEEIECPLIPVLVEMEGNGIALDVNALSEISEKLADQIDDYRKTIYELAGHEFNLNSPKQLGEVLFDEMHLVEKPKKTKTGQYKTNEEELQKLAGEHEIVAKILDYRGATKLKSTYVDALPGFICEKTGRIHTSFNQAVTTTGRLASSDPNIQNIPVRTEQGQEIRRAFVPRDACPEGTRRGNFQLLAADYSQIELRIMAHLSGDDGMKQAFIDGEDIHTATAAKVFGVSPDDVTKEQRRRSKMVNFGIIYGISAFGLSQRLRIPRKEAAEIIENYFAQYPAVKTFMDSLIEGAKEKGYVETVTGRRRHIRDINSKNGTVRSAAERYAINAPIQGSAADLIKIAMIRIEKMLRGKQSKLLLQVHDELVFDLHNDEQDLIPEIQKLMQDALPLSVPLIVDCGVGDNWLQAH